MLNLLNRIPVTTGIFHKTAFIFIRIKTMMNLNKRRRRRKRKIKIPVDPPAFLPFSNTNRFLKKVNKSHAWVYFKVIFFIKKK